MNKPTDKQRPAPMDLQDKNTWMANPEVRKISDDWENSLDQAKNPKTLDDRIEAKDTRRRIMQHYNNLKSRKTLGDDELLLIGKHKSQLNKPVVTPVITPVFKTEVKEFIPRTPEIPLNEIIRDKARMKPGITKDLIQLQSDIRKNVDYVMGNTTRKNDSEKEESQDTTTGEPND
tara:strand:- start:310 stop:834 length:525 start_codon:yes stop_codon:yes gene_type:complete